MNAEAAVTHAPAAIPVTMPAGADLRERIEKGLESTGRWILIVLYVFGLVFPLVGALAAWVYS